MLQDSTHISYEEMQKRLSQLEHENEVINTRLQIMERSASESEMRFSQLYQASFEGIAIFKNGRIILVNQALCKLFGHERDEMLQMKIGGLFSPQYRDTALKKIKQNISKTFETLCIRKSGHIFPAKVHGKFIPFEGEDARVLVIDDITTTKQTEKELIEKDIQYRKLFEETRDAIYISSTYGKLIKVNKACLELFGYTKKEMLEMPAKNLYYNKEDRTTFQKEIEKKGSLYNYEIRLRKKDGTPIDTTLTSTARKNLSGEIIGYQGIIHDITERKKNEELKKAKELAERSASMKEKFLANMSHEIRTPMNAVIGMSNLLGNTPLNDEQKKYLYGIKGASEHLLVLINDILDFSKIEAGKLQIEQITFNLKEVLENIIQTFKFKMKEKKLDFILNLENNLPFILIGDPTRITQILLNLVSNAYKFTKQGSISIDVKMFEEDIRNVVLAFTVTDTGIGIPQEQLDNIFGVFEQVSRDTTRRFGGTGLGLAITKKLVEMQGGHISVKSKIGEGSSFIFTIKYEKGDASSIDLKNNSNTLQKDIIIQKLGKLNILLVEDNELNKVVAMETLKKWGDEIHIDHAENGLIALDLVQSDTKKYDLILMDVQMPKLNGYDTTKKIRGEFGLTDIPILAMTAYATTGEAEKAIVAGMNDYISKPFNPKKLYQKIVQLTGVEIIGQEKTTQKDNTVQQQTQAPQSKVTDLSFLEEATNGDPDMLYSMLEIMIRETPEEIAHIERYFHEKNWPKLRAAAHKFKSAVSYMGLHNIKDHVKNIQLYAETEENLDQLYPMISQVKEICQIAVEELKEKFENLNK